jgi:hypothetical protein
MTVPKTDRVRLKKARDAVQQATGQVWTAHKFCEYLVEHKITLHTKQGQPCHEFQQVHPSYGTAAISTDDLATLLAFFAMNTQES